MYYTNRLSEPTISYVKASNIVELWSGCLILVVISGKRELIGQNRQKSLQIRNLLDKIYVQTFIYQTQVQQNQNGTNLHLQLKLDLVNIGYIQHIDCMNNESFKLHHQNKGEQTYLMVQEGCNKYNITCLTIAYDKTLIVTSNYRQTFIKKLLGEIDKCLMFEGRAVLKPSSRHKKYQSKAGQVTPSSSKSTDVNEYMISYRLDLVQKPKFEQQKTRTIARFEKMCDKIHKIIEIVMERYRLQSKVGFWLTVFQEQLVKINNRRENQKIMADENQQLIVKKVEPAVQIKSQGERQEIF